MQATLSTAPHFASVRLTTVCEAKVVIADECIDPASNDGAKKEMELLAQQLQPSL